MTAATTVVPSIIVGGRKRGESALYFSMMLALALVTEASSDGPPVPVAPPPLVRVPVAPPPVIVNRPPPVPGASVAQYFSQDDYPIESIRLGEEGAVKMRLTVGTDGRVAGCGIVEGSGYARLDAASCAILSRRARFRPARNGAGEPVVDYLVVRVRWVLPEDEPALVDTMSTARLTLDRRHRVVGCSMQYGVEPAGTEESCAAHQAMVDRLFAQRRVVVPTGTTMLIEQMIVDFDPQDMMDAVVAPTGATLLSDDLSHFMLDEQGRAYVRCVRVAHSGPALATDLCALGPQVTPPQGVFLDPGQQRSGAIRRRLWAARQR